MAARGLQVIGSVWTVPKTPNQCLSDLLRSWISTKFRAPTYDVRVLKCFILPRGPSQACILGTLHMPIGCIPLPNSHGIGTRTFQCTPVVCAPPGCLTALWSLEDTVLIPRP